MRHPPQPYSGAFACRLEDGLTWDTLLSTVSSLFFTFKRAHGWVWPLGLGLAATRMVHAGDSRRLTADDGADGEKSIIDFSPPGKNPVMSDKCATSCRACPRCLRFEQVSNPLC